MVLISILHVEIFKFDLKHYDYQKVACQEASLIMNLINDGIYCVSSLSAPLI